MSKLVWGFMISLIVFLVIMGYLLNKEGLATSRIPCVRPKEERHRPTHKLSWFKKGVKRKK